MLNLLKKLSEFRMVVLLSLILPIPFVLWNFSNIFSPLPEYPFPKYTITFKSPGMMAKEIERKVIAPAEKLFNGLQGLLLLESVILHEKAEIELEFLNGENSDRALLFIQEKLDRLKVILPNNVNEIIVKLRKRPIRPDLEVHIPEGILAYQWNLLLENLGAVITRSEPYIENYQSLSIKIDVALLRENKLALGDVGKALKVSGLTYRLGKESGVSYLLDGTYNSKAQIENILIGSRGHRPIRLADIANINLQLPKAPKKVKIWIDKQLYEKEDIKSQILDQLKGSEVVDPLPLDLKEFIMPNLIIGIGILLIQALIFYLTFSTFNAVGTILIFDTLWVGEYLFINWLKNGEITHFDFASLFISNIIACYLWHFLLCRIRSYFLPSKLENFIKRDIQQAIYFSLVEYIPTFLFLYVLLGTLSLPILLGNINIVSKVIVTNVLIFSPLSILFLVVMALFGPLDWIKDKVNVKNKYASTFLTKDGKVWTIIPLFLFAISLPFFLDKLTLGVSGGSALNDWRGTGSKLHYYTKNSSLEDNEKLGLEVLDNIKYGPVMNWDITPTGLSSIAKRDINSFQRTLQDMAQQKSVLQYEDLSRDMTVNYHRSVSGVREFGELTLGGNGNLPMPLRIYTNPKVKLMEEHIFRGQLSRQSKVTMGDSLTKRNIFHKPLGRNLLASSKTRFMFKEYEHYLNNHWTVLLFLFVILSLFLNSFNRGGILCIFAMSVWKCHEILGMAIGSTFNLDSLWVSTLPLWVCLTVILLLSKEVDIERIRGNDKEDALNDLSSKMSLPIIYGILSFILSFSWWWFASNVIFDNGYLNYSHELLGISGSILIVGGLTFFLFFRLYYVTSESIIESFRLRIYLWYYRKKYSK